MGNAPEKNLSGLERKEERRLNSVVEKKKFSASQNRGEKA